jgi:hypothetical protein
MWVSKLERWTDGANPTGDKSARDPLNLPVNDLFRLAYALGCSPWALISGWEPDQEVSIGGDGPTMTTAQLWGWANWDEWPTGDDPPDVWLRFSPRNRPNLTESDWAELEQKLGRPVTVHDEGGTRIAMRLDDEWRWLITAWERVMAGGSPTEEDMKNLDAISKQRKAP